MTMNPQGNESEHMRNALAIGIWEDEGGASGRDSLDEHYGLRIEGIGPGLSTMSLPAFPRVQTVRP